MFVLISIFIAQIFILGCSSSPPRFPETVKSWSAEPQTQMASATDLQRFEQLMMTYSKGADTEQLSRDLDAARRKLIAAQDPIVMRRINQARALILQSPEPEDVYAWPTIREFIGDIGVKIPVIALPDSKLIQENGNRLRMGVLFETVVVNQDDFLQEHIAISSGILAHEATHLAFDEAVKNYSGYNQVELLLLQELCVDFKLAFLYATEAMAFWNQSAGTLMLIKAHEGRKEGVLDRGDAVHYVESFLNPVQNLFAFGAHTYPDQMMEKWANSLMEYVQPQLDLEESAANPNITMHCGPPIILRGWHRGEYLNLVKFAPNPLRPLFAHLQARLRLLQYLGKLKAEQS